MSFEEALREHFPDALPESDFVTRTYQMLWRHGFTDRSAIACVSVCRDEMTRPLIDTIQRTWGEAFNFSSLAGMVFLGKTGFLTAQQHAPRKDGIERYVFFGLPHIAISQNGEPGVCYRPGRDERSPACGALAAFREELRSGSLSLETDPDDIERSLMNQRLHRVLPQARRRTSFP